MGIVSRVVQGFSKNRWSFAPLFLGNRGLLLSQSAVYKSQSCVLWAVGSNRLG